MNLTVDEKKIVEKAIAILENGFKREPFSVTNDTAAINYCRLKFGGLENEVFAALFLDNQHVVIECVELFRGTIDSCSVYPREVVKKALLLNSAAVVFCHNHPSGVADPSRADEVITERLISALELVGVRVLDHVIVTAIDSYSFAVNGKI